MEYASIIVMFKDSQLNDCFDYEKVYIILYNKNRVKEEWI